MLIQEDLQGHAGKQWRPILGPDRQLVRYPFSLCVKDFPKWRKLRCQRIMKQRNLRSFKMVQLRSRFCVHRYASYYINQVVLPLVNSDLILSYSWIQIPKMRFYQSLRKKQYFEAYEILCWEKSLHFPQFCSPFHWIEWPFIIRSQWSKWSLTNSIGEKNLTSCCHPSLGRVFKMMLISWGSHSVR